VTDELFRVVQDTALYDRPIPERHRIIFYLGHLEAFDWNLIARHALELPAFHPTFDRLFAFGIDPTNGKLPDDQPGDWPRVPEIAAYNREVRTRIDASCDGAVEDRLLHVALEHRLMHAETLAYMLHQLPLERKCAPPAAPPPSPTPAVKPRRIEIPAGTATLGLARYDAAFGWDNEFERQEATAPSFAIDAYKVSNGEYLEFLRAGGYRERSLWPEEAWTWKEQQGIECPVFWKRQGEQWRYRTMFDEVPLPLDWPVYVSHAEASAYARWKGLALPTETQFHRAAFGSPSGEERAYPWGAGDPPGVAGNFDFRSWDPAPVTAHPETRSAFGVAGLVGNGWEWTSTVFGPFTGFERFPFYPGYSADFFDGKHYVIKGGSSRTAACLLRRSFRNWFQPHYQYVYAAFRCVEN
jgi:ergothioneine biosynthesis protein EgtB